MTSTHDLQMVSQYLSEAQIIYWTLHLGIIKQYANVVYKTTNSGFGEEASKITPQRPLQHGFNGKFSMVSNSKTPLIPSMKHLSKSGMPVNNGLNTAKDRDRFLDYCKDWQDKKL